jgi:hypothetical protein
VFVYVDTSGVGVGVTVLGAIGVGVLVLVLDVFVVVIVVRMAVRMIVFRPIGVHMRMGVIASTHGATNSRSGGCHPAGSPDDATPVLWAKDHRQPQRAISRECSLQAVHERPCTTSLAQPRSARTLAPCIKNASNRPGPERFGPKFCVVR